jgi:SAM-dependent methyltransferase
VTAPGAAYERIGTGYGPVRRPDPRIAAALADALGDAGVVLNVGAGAGSYEPTDRRVVAVEPASVMLAQRPAGAAPAVRAVAERLPCRDAAVDAVLGVLTVHHWHDQRAGLRECLRVARDRVVLLTWDPAFAGALWLVRDYLPAIRDLDAGRFRPLAELEAALGPVDVRPVPIPHDCTDGFMGAYWRRPAAYLDPAVQAGISTLRQIAPDEKERGLAALAADLASGAWDARYGALRGRETLDLGYRIVIARRR